MKKTEKLLIDITFNLLYKKGYTATNITEILDQANMTKGAMYYHFKSKHALVLATLKYNLENMLQNYWIEPLKDTKEPIKAITDQICAYCTMFADKNNFLDIKYGCPMSNFIQDMSAKDEEIFEYLKSIYKRWQISVEEALDRAKIQQQTNTEFDSRRQALFIISSLEGTIGSAKAYNDPQALQDSLRTLIDYIEKL